MEIKIDYESTYTTLEKYYERAWENKEFFSGEDITQVIGDLSIIDWDKFFELMNISLTDGGPAKLGEMNYPNLHSLTENEEDVNTVIPYVKSLINGEEPEHLDPYHLSGAILIIAMFICDHYTKTH